MQAQTAMVRPEQLRVEYRVNPLGIDVTRPRLSWQLAAVDPQARDLKQSAYRILAASSEELLQADKGDLWDSGHVESDRSIQVEYDGLPLTSGMRVCWKVQAWDQHKRASAWSPPAYWSMGLLQAGDWQGTWIGRDEAAMLKDPVSPYWNLTKAHWIWTDRDEGGARTYRASLAIPADRKIRRALCVMGADRHFELAINGQTVGQGDAVEMPGVFDITPNLHPGDNPVEVKATGRGRRPGVLIGALRVEFAAGEPLLLLTGPEWKGSGVVQDVGAYGMAPWGEVGFTQERWLPARMLRKEFQVAGKVKRATAYFSGLGLSELYVNGARIGDQVLSPGLTDYDKRALYVTFDVTSQIAAGHNAVGIILGNGRYWAPRSANPIGTRSFGYPKARLQLELEMQDGTTSRIVSDESWKLTADGPIRGNNEYDGEEYDARQEMPRMGSAPASTTRHGRRRTRWPPPPANSSRRWPSRCG